MLRRANRLAVAVLGGLGAFGAGSAGAASGTITIEGSTFGPVPGPFHVGDTVTWTNADDVPHDVAGVDGPPGFASPLLDPGGSWSFRFDDAGTFTYVCTLHEGMAAALTIEAHDAAAPAAVEAPADSGATNGEAAPADGVAAGEGDPASGVAVGGAASGPAASAPGSATAGAAPASDPVEPAPVAGSAPADAEEAAAPATAATRAPASVAGGSHLVVDLRLLGASLLTFAAVAVALLSTARRPAGGT